MSIKTETIRARVPTELKEKSEAILDHLGLSTSEAMRMFLSQIVNRQEFPLELRVDKTLFEDSDDGQDEASDHQTSQAKRGSISSYIKGLLGAGNQGYNAEDQNKVSALYLELAGKSGTLAGTTDNIVQYAKHFEQVIQDNKKRKDTSTNKEEYWKFVDLVVATAEKMQCYKAQCMEIEAKLADFERKRKQQ